MLRLEHLHLRLQIKLGDWLYQSKKDFFEKFRLKGLFFGLVCDILLLEGALPRGFDPTSAIILAEGKVPSFLLFRNWPRLNPEHHIV